MAIDAQRNTKPENMPRAKPDARIDNERAADDRALN